MSGHFLELSGAAIVATEQVLDAKAMIADAFDARAMAAVHGGAGTGKSFAVAQAVVDLPPRDWVSMDFRARPTIRDVRQSLVQALGLGVSSFAPFDADRSLKRVLAERPRLVVVDEAQWLNRECFEYLRYLYDTPFTCFSLLFVEAERSS
jgi:type II secretory pathway predicted ATPase ExeA